MTKSDFGVNTAIQEYIEFVSVTESEHASELRKYTENLPERNMQVSKSQAQFIKFLVKTLDVTKAIEVGVFTGYSALAIAESLPDTGKLIACDISEEWTSVGAKYWEAANVSQKIELKIAPASDTLASMIQENQTDSYDFAFIDADKTGYEKYVDQCHTLLRKGGVIMLDNVLWSGAVCDLSVTDESTVALRNLNLKLKDDSRFDIVLLPIADGVTLLRKTFNVHHTALSE